MAGFNINVGDDEIGPVDPGSIPKGEAVDVPGNNAKGRIILEKRIRDFEKAVDKIQIRLKSQVLTAGAMAQQRARSAKTPERLNEVISGMIDKQNNRIKGLEVDLLKSFDTIKTWIKTTGGTQDDIDHVTAIYESLDSGDLESAPDKVQEIMDKLKDVSLKEIQARKVKKDQDLLDLENKRKRKKMELDDAKYMKERLKQAEGTAASEAEIARRQVLSSRATELELTPLETMTDFIDRILLMGRRGKVSGTGPSARRARVLEDADRAAKEAFQRSLAPNIPIPTPEEVAAGKRALASGAPPIAPPVAGQQTPSPGGGGSVFGRIGAALTVAAVVDQAVSSAINSAGRTARDVSSGDPSSIARATFGNGMFNFIGKALNEVVSTLDTIAKNTEQKTLAFSPDLINASVNRQIQFLEMNIQRGEKLGKVLGDVANARTQLEISSQKVADKIIEYFGPHFVKILEFMSMFLDATSIMVTFFKHMTFGNGASMFTSQFWVNILIDAKNSVRGTPATVTDEMETFFNSDPKSKAGVDNTNLPFNGIFK